MKINEYGCDFVRPDLLCLPGNGQGQLFGDNSPSSNPDWYTLPQYHGNDTLDGGKPDAINDSKWNMAA